MDDLDDLAPITPERLGPFAQLLGVHVVPKPAAVADHLVVCGHRVTNLAEIMTALGLKAADDDAEPDPLGDEKGLRALAQAYAARICIYACIDNGRDATPWKLRVGQDGLTKKQRAKRDYYARHREQIRAHQQACRDARRAARQAAMQPAPQAPAEAPKPARRKPLEQVLAEIDADSTLTAKQKSARRYIARHRDELLQAKRDAYHADPEAARARRLKAYHQRRATTRQQEQQPCA